jgi:S1-C subfamily serine protease
VFLDLDGDGISVQGFGDKSGAKAAGLKKGDQIMQVGEVPIESYSDIRVALMDQQPGETVEVKVLRKRVFLDDESHSFQVELH